MVVDDLVGDYWFLEVALPDAVNHGAA